MDVAVTADTAAIFFSTLVSVLAIGMQTRAISKHQAGLAVLCSALIAGCQLVALKLIPNTSGLANGAAYIIAGTLGIHLSFGLHRLVAGGSERPLALCEGKESCPFSGEPCKGDETSCPVHRTFSKTADTKGGSNG